MGRQFTASNVSLQQTLWQVWTTHCLTRADNSLFDKDRQFSLTREDNLAGQEQTTQFDKGRRFSLTRTDNPLFDKGMQLTIWQGHTTCWFTRTDNSMLDKGRQLTVWQGQTTHCLTKEDNSIFDKGRQLTVWKGKTTQFLTRADNSVWQVTCLNNLKQVMSESLQVTSLT